MYHFTIEWRAGKTYCIADALSRALYFPPDTSSEVNIFKVFQDEPALNVTRDNVDKEYAAIRHFVHLGRYGCPANLSEYRSVWAGLRVEADLFVVG